MSLIKILPETLVNQIAAGEVIERPASVIKELLDNCLDAGADKIVVEVKDGGKTFIKITDNGCGIAKDDLEMAIQRHATSKITEESDLWKIGTMGFRGEALASIASVSKLAVKSKVADSDSGWEIEVNGGDVVAIREVGMSGGTRIEVHNLFFNTPARQKYLKKDSTELSYITAALNAVALANPEVAFKLVHNDKTVMDLPKVTDLISRVSDVFGSATAEAMIPIFYGGSDFQIEGFIGKPLLARSSSKHQYFFVNGRPIQHHVLANTIRQAYHSMLMENKKPVFIINIKIDPALIDVNVHPRKVEIRFEDQQSVIRTMYSSVKSALEKVNLIPKGFSESRRYMSDSFPKKVENAGLFEGNDRMAAGSIGGQSFGGGFDNGGAREPVDFAKSVMNEREFGGVEEKNDGMKAITQVSNSYIVAQDESGLVLIDQHAAHERVRYEELMNQFETQEKSIQPLLMPIQLELSADEVMLVEENKKIFEDLGFEIEPFGGKTFVVHAVPSFFSKEDIDDVVRGVLDDIINEKNPSRFQGKTEEILTYMSCRSAIKFGQSLELSEMQILIDQMTHLKRPYTCPHGRPTMVSLSLSELEKMFGRK
ncbi:DNA mismatch repair endonuclease MutL [Candidatus Peregrinibacteria bacterium]|jgi:DNA mismatch repair protein MutL|nr:DNA mismatch repair endonuclease MutL [Candidatus Peregrinibacteria bacterium]